MVDTADLVPYDLRPHRRRTALGHVVAVAVVLLWTAVSWPIVNVVVHLLPHVDDNLTPLVWLLAIAGAYLIWAERLPRAQQWLRERELQHLAWQGAVREHLIFDRDRRQPEIEALFQNPPARRLIGGRDLHQWTGTVRRNGTPIRITITVDDCGTVDITED